MLRATVPFLAGLILVPVGGIVAIVAIAVAALTIMVAAKGTLGDPVSVVMFLGIYALEYGCLAAAPVTIVVLPLSYVVLRRKSALAVRTFVVAGVASAILESGILLLWWSISNGHFQGLVSFMALITVVLVLSGLLTGFAFAHLTRLARPTDWTRPVPSRI